MDIYCTVSYKYIFCSFYCIVLPSLVDIFMLITLALFGNILCDQRDGSISGLGHIFLALKMVKVAMSQGMCMTLRSWKRQAN